MPVTLDDTKRSALGSKMAELKAFQELLIFSEQQLLSEIDDEEGKKDLQSMIESDQKNLGVIETAYIQYGVKGEPKQTTQQFIETVKKLMQGSELSTYEKAAQFELLKHKQFMAGVLIHKAAQVIGADVQAAISPINTVNFENRGHQEQFKVLLERLGVRELTGQNPDQGLLSRIQDAAAAAAGVVGSVITQGSDKKDMNIQDIIRMDHAKVNTIFTEIGATNDPQKIQEYFGQMYKDLLVHAQAEEEVVYPAVRPYYGENDTQELYDEQAEMKQMLDQIKALDPASSEFKDRVKQLMDVVGDHIRQEESTMFAAIRNNFSDEQSEQLATKFKEAKSKLQDQMVAS